MRVGNEFQAVAQATEKSSL